MLSYPLLASFVSPCVWCLTAVQVEKIKGRAYVEKLLSSESMLDRTLDPAWLQARVDHAKTMGNVLLDAYP